MQFTRILRAGSAGLSLFMLSAVAQQEVPPGPGGDGGTGGRTAAELSAELNQLKQELADQRALLRQLQQQLQQQSLQQSPQQSPQQGMAARPAVPTVPEDWAAPRSANAA